MRKKYTNLLLGSILLLALTGCKRPANAPKTEEEIMEELNNAPEIYEPEESTEPMTPAAEEGEIQIEDGEQGSF